MFLKPCNQATTFPNLAWYSHWLRLEQGNKRKDEKGRKQGRKARRGEGKKEEGTTFDI